MQNLLRRKHILLDDIPRVCRALFVRLFRSYFNKTIVLNRAFLQNYQFSGLNLYPTKRTTSAISDTAVTIFFLNKISCSTKFTMHLIKMASVIIFFNIIHENITNPVDV